MWKTLPPWCPSPKGPQGPEGASRCAALRFDGLSLPGDLGFKNYKKKKGLKLGVRMGCFLGVHFPLSYIAASVPEER